MTLPAHHALNERGIALRRAGDPLGALACYERAIALHPSYPEAHNNRGNVLRDAGRDDAALAAYDRALELNPSFHEAHENRGSLLRAMGRRGEALESMRRSVGGGRARAYYGMAVAEHRFSGEEVAAMLRLAREPRLPDDDAVELSFALGAALHGRGDRDDAFRWWLRGNALQRRRTNYDEWNALDRSRRAAEAYSRAAVEGLLGSGPASRRPVFVVGVPRSGTTLLEQVLSRHPSVDAAGEVDYLAEACDLAGQRRLLAGAPPTRDQLRAVGERYLAILDLRHPGDRLVVNKLPENALHLGLVALALPGARVLHCRRDPLDSCLSAFTRYFGGRVPWSYDLGELGRSWRSYDALSAHWGEALPGDVLMDVRYEDVVVNLERQARAALRHLGLAWDPACLDFHLSERRVDTASALQVRRPVYATSVGWHRDYSAHLGPLRAALGPRHEDARP